MVSKNKATRNKSRSTASGLTDQRKGSRRASDTVLLHNEKYFRSLVEYSMDAIVVLNRDGSTVYKSPSYINVLGYKSEDGFSDNMFKHLHPDDVQKAANEFAQIIQNPREILHSEVRARHKDGSWRVIEATGRNLLDDPAVEGIVVNMRDVTERKHSEEALLDQREWYHSLIENSLDAVVVLNGDGTPRYVGSAAQRVLGYSLSELGGRNPIENVHPDDVQVASEVFTMLLRDSGRTVHTEIRTQHKDGSWRTLEVVGKNLLNDPKVNGIVCNFHDVTERKQAEEALRQSEQEYSLLVGNLADAVFRYREGVITWANDRIKEMLGYTNEELIGTDVKLFLSDDTPFSEVYSEANAELKQQSHFHGTTKARRKDGSVADIEFTASLVPGKDPFEIVGIARDITESKRVEAERRTMEQQLLLSGRLAAVGELAAGVAHEINNPLAAVQGYAQLLSSRKDLDESTRSDVNCIFNEAKRASRITANLLSFAHKHEPEKIPTSINDLINESLELHIYRLRVNNIDVEIKLDPDLPNTMVDRHQIQQVFVNLITNAEQAMTKANGKGTLSIKTQSLGEMIEIIFTDNGPGIQKDNLKSIFDPFFTTKEVGEGTGLGLSICFGIIQEHGGQISATSKPGDGATFTVELPIVSEKLSEPEQTEAVQIE